MLVTIASCSALRRQLLCRRTNGRIQSPGIQSNRHARILNQIRLKQNPCAFLLAMHVWLNLLSWQPLWDLDLCWSCPSFSGEQGKVACTTLLLHPVSSFLMQVSVKGVGIQGTSMSSLPLPGSSGLRLTALVTVELTNRATLSVAMLTSLAPVSVLEVACSAALLSLHPAVSLLARTLVCSCRFWCRLS